MTVIQHNLMAMNANRQLGISTEQKSKASEKLSSGYKIKRAADDTAGLSISEKMRWQIRGLNQASRNIGDGISLVKVADGALNETHAVLQRMRELAVQAANDTNADSDRQAIQNEIDELTKEVDRIAKDTSFNQDIYALTANKFQLTINGVDYDLDLQEKTSYFVAPQNGIVHEGITYNNGDMISVTGLYFHSDKAANYLYTDARAIDMGNHSIFNTYVDSYDLHISDLKEDADGWLYFETKSQLWGAGIGTKLYWIVNPLELNAGGMGIDVTNNKNSMPSSDWSAIKMSLKPGIKIQAGAQAWQNITINPVDATVSGIGLGQVNVMSHDTASTAISAVDNAIEKVSSYRSYFGAVQNRLEHAQLVDDNTAENTQAAESKLRDTEMATMMVAFSKYNILSQAGQSMLAQANQSQQDILKLIQQ